MHYESCGDDHMPVTRGYMRELCIRCFMPPPPPRSGAVHPTSPGPSASGPQTLHSCPQKDPPTAVGGPRAGQCGPDAGCLLLLLGTAAELSIGPGEPSDGSDCCTSCPRAPTRAALSHRGRNGGGSDRRWHKRWTGAEDG